MKLSCPFLFHRIIQSHPVFSSTPDQTIIQKLSSLIGLLLQKRYDFHS